VSIDQTASEIRPGPRPPGASRLLDLLYLIASVLLTPFFIYRRIVKRKRSAPLRSKLGHIESRPAGKQRLWIHAVSVGEAALAETFIKAARAKWPGIDIAVSTTTVTGQELARKKYGPENVFYYPLDLSWAVRRALDRVKPSVLVLSELEVWPNMTAECVLRGIPIVVINGRITARAAKRYAQFWFLVGPSFHRVKRWLVQSSEYSDRLKSLGVANENIEISGNMKYDAVDTVADPSGGSSVRNALGIAANAHVLVGASTHPSEEATILSAFSTLREKLPDVRLILVPRHPERAGDVESDVRAAALNPMRLSVLRAAGKSLSSNDVLIVDMVGELKNMFKAADVAFIGGSLIAHGGQNVMEPSGLGVPVVHGPHMHNFNDAMEILRACNGSVEVSRESLSSELDRLLKNPEAARAMAIRARNGFLSKQGATARTINYIAEVLPDP